MKKFFILLFVIASFTAIIKNTVPYLSVSVVDEPCFARVKYNNVLLYKTPTQNNNYENVFCLLEPSYFVEVVKDESQLFFKVHYLNLVGYTLKSQVECVFETPLTPYPANITLATTNFSSVVMRQEPTTKDSNAIIILEPNSTLTYYGKIAGQTATEGLGNLWYYVSYESLEGEKVDGYVYSALTHNFTPILENVEQTSLTEYGAANRINTFLNIKPQFHFILIALTFVPLVVVLITFLKRSKVNNVTK
jgi:hypothetical protein